MTKAPTLRQRIAVGLFLYSLLLAAVVLLFGYLANERIEAIAWRSLLETESIGYREHAAHEPGYPLPENGAIRGYLDPADKGQTPVPAALRSLDLGFHHDLDLDGHPTSVLVQSLPSGQRLYMTVNAVVVEQSQRQQFLWSVVLALSGIIVLVAVTYWLAGRLLRPISRFSASVDALEPGIREQRKLPVPENSGELASIARAINGYLGRIDAFVHRERAFINTMSHELRTPLAVLQSASDVLDARPDLGEDARKTVRRMQRTLRDSDQLVETLLVLARDPERLARSSEAVALDDLLREIIDDHATLLDGRSMQMESGSIAHVVVHAPPRAIWIAVSNLLRNAIEHGGAGTIHVGLDRDATIRIESPRQDLTPEDIARTFTERARRGESRSSEGIGLPLIMRLCEHMGWTLDLSETPDGSTLAVLRLASRHEGG